jgi:hypothetical protein
VTIAVVPPTRDTQTLFLVMRRWRGYPPSADSAPVKAYLREADATVAATRLNDATTGYGWYYVVVPVDGDAEEAR